MDLTTLQPFIIADRAESLAQLCWALRQDMGWRTMCGARSLETMEFRANQLLDALRSGTDTPLIKADGLCLLWALDQWLTDGSTGSAPLCVRLEDHEPPLWVAPRPAGWKSVVQGPDQVERWMTKHAVGPCENKGIEVRISVAPAHLIQGWAQRSALMVAGFEDQVGPDNNATLPEFHSTDLSTPTTRMETFSKLLPEVCKVPLLVLVLPELSLTPTLRALAMDALLDTEGPPLLSVLGTYHETVDDKRYNIAVLADRHGKGLLSQRKIQPLNVPTIRECIEPGSVIELLVGPWGTLAIAICRDFCELNQDIWAGFAPDLILVPSMGNPSTMSAHKKRAATLHTHAKTVVCMANQPVDFKEKPKIHGFISANGQIKWSEYDELLQKTWLRVDYTLGGLEQD